MEKPVFAISIVGESAVLIDVTTGEILYEKNPDQPMYPASITKIMTVLLALEKGNLDDIVTVSRNAMTQEGTRIYLEEGEQVKVRELVYGTLLNSGNDSAIAIAEHLGGTVEGFANMMNEKARELGMNSTHFVNPSGLPDENHVTTARDMGLLGTYALKNPIFQEIARSKFYDANWIGENVHAILQNHNRLLWEYPYSTGLKTGYTVISRSTIVASARKDDRDLIAVVLKSDPRAYYKDAIQLFDYGYTNTSLLPILQMKEKTTSLYETTIHYIPKENPSTVVIDGQMPALQMIEKFNPEKETSIFDQILIHKGETIGKVEILKDGELYDTVDLIATENVVNTFPLKKVIAYSALVILLILVISLRLLWKRKKERRTKRKRPWLIDNEY